MCLYFGLDSSVGSFVVVMEVQNKPLIPVNVKYFPVLTEGKMLITDVFTVSWNLDNHKFNYAGIHITFLVVLLS